MSYLKLFRDEPEIQAPQPLPFPSPEQSWRDAGKDDSRGEDQMDSITRVEEALSQVESTFEDLSEQVEDFCQPIRMADWLDEQDDGPYAA